MGFVSIIGACICCGKMFGFHPNKVPSIRIKGTRQPICQECIDKEINPKRKANGLPEITYERDAYVGCDEHEVDWGD